MLRQDQRVLRARQQRQRVQAQANRTRQEAEEDTWLNDIGPFARMRALALEMEDKPGGLDRGGIEEEPTVPLGALPAGYGLPRSLEYIGLGHPLWPVVRSLSERIWRELRLQLQDEQEEEPVEEALLVAQVRRRAQALLHVEPQLSGLLRNRAEVALLLQSVVNEVLGYGPLEVLLKDEQITEILAVGPRLMYVELDGQMQEIPPRFASERHMARIIENMLRRAGRDSQADWPVMDFRLPDGTFVNIVLSAGTTNGSTILVRKCPRKLLGLDNLVENKTMSPQMAAFLHACVRERRNIVICGNVGSGRTTLLNALAACVPASERIVTIEETAELRLGQRHAVSLVASLSPGKANGTGESVERVTTRDLIQAALHMRPDRLILGECRGDEVGELFRAMHAGYDGTLTTLYARNSRDALSRLETLYRLEDPDAPVSLIREQIADALDVIVYLARLRTGSHKIIEIAQVQGLEEDAVKLRSLFVAKKT
jgi:pilus assembly protein CpaF